MFPALQRVFDASECRTQMQLVALLEIRQSSISDAKRRGSIPSDWLIKLQRLKGINPEWVMTGEGEPFIKNEATDCGQAKAQKPEEFTTEDLVVELVRRGMKYIRNF